ncbi:MAG TPA: thiamine pyrophosphate-dependent enzyme, partial [Streptosporangiaceae bacterium]|nr:thiamine pyrophosphate-dependent enzyme [Streptosporangiaceae bacterium]
MSRLSAEQEDANAAAGEPLSVKARAFSMPGVTVDGGDPVLVYDAVSAAINEAISQEMTRGSSVLYFGQNIATTENDEFLKAFGGDRVRVTPISETAEIGMAVGAALAGYRPVVELYMA